MDLRRSDFEAMHPNAKLFSFDDETKMYFGESVDAINKQWATWCACLGLACLEIEAAKTQANKQFESFLNQAIEDSACADERRSLQVLLEDFQDNLEADKRQGQKRVSVNLEDL